MGQLRLLWWSLCWCSTVLYAETRGLSLADVKIWDMLESQPLSALETAGETQNETPEDSLWARGYKSMRVVVGQGGSEVQQELRLQVQGAVAPGWYLEGLLIDEGLSVGELRVSSLQDVSAMYLRLYKDRTVLSLGETKFSHRNSTLGDYHHATAGVGLESLGKKVQSQVVVGQSSARNRTAVIAGYDGQRHGYLIAESGDFVAVVPNSETVWWQGRKLQRGVDYRMEYVGGVLDFLGAHSPSSRDEIVISYQEWEEGAGTSFLGADLQGQWRYLNLRASLIDLGGDSSSTPEGLMLAGVTFKPLADLWLGGELFYNQYEASRLGVWQVGSDSVWNPRGRSWFYRGEGFHQQAGFSNLGFDGGPEHWNSYNLQRHWLLAELDSNEARNFERVRWGWGGAGGLTSWLDWGYKHGYAWNSRRLAWVVQRYKPRAQTTWEIAQIEAWQGEQPHSAWQTDLRSRTGLGPLDLYGGAFGAVRYQEHSAGPNRSLWQNSTPQRYEWELNSGFKQSFWYFDDWQEDLKLEGVNLHTDQSSLDSLQRLVWTQSFNVGQSNWRWDSFVQGQWLRTENSSQRHFLGSGEQRFHWWQSAWEFNGLHRLDLTTEQLFRPIYKKVEPGLGDVMWDSLSGEFIVGVDRGDYIYDGAIRDDSLPAVRTSEGQFSGDLWWFPREQFAVRHGILADLSFGFFWMLQGRDTNRVMGQLPWTAKNMENMVDAQREWSQKTRWHPQGSGVDLWFTWGREVQKVGGTYTAWEQRDFQQLDLHWILNADWNWQGALTREVVERTLPQRLAWSSWLQQHYWFWEFHRHWGSGPSLRWQQSAGNSLWGSLATQLWVPGLVVQWQPYGRRVIRAEYGWAWLRSEGELVPYRLSQGYAPGVTHRLEVQGEHSASDGVVLLLNYLLRRDASGVFHKLSGEVRLDF